MKRSKSVTCCLAIVFFALASMTVAVPFAVGGSAQDKCPVMGGSVSKDVYADYQGKRIYFCCPACPEEFKKDPAKYIKKIEDQGVTLEAAPKN